MEIAGFKADTISLRVIAGPDATLNSETPLYNNFTYDFMVDNFEARNFREFKVSL